MAKWMKYTGSEAQLKELLEVKDGYLVACKWDSGEVTTGRIVSMPFSIFIKTPVGQYVTHYLICKPHPLARMKEQHSQTRQPVWAANKETGKTNYYRGTVNWDLPNTEYSFTPFTRIFPYEDLSELEETAMYLGRGKIW